MDLMEIGNPEPVEIGLYRDLAELLRTSFEVTYAAIVEFAISDHLMSYAIKLAQSKRGWKDLLRVNGEAICRARPICEGFILEGTRLCPGSRRDRDLAECVMRDTIHIEPCNRMGVGRYTKSPLLHLIQRKAMVEIIKAVLVLVILFSPTITWSQTQDTDQSNPLEYAQQSPASQSNPAPASPTDSGTASLPDQASAPQNKEDDSRGKQTKRIFGLLPNFAAVDANTQLPPLSTHEKFALAARDSPSRITPRLRGQES